MKYDTRFSQNSQLLRNAAFELLNESIAPIPAAPGTKQPALKSWKEYQQRLPTREEVQRWFDDDDVWLGVVTSQGFGIIDIDPHLSEQRDLLFTELIEKANRVCSSLAEKLCKTRRVKTPNGKHLWLRCACFSELHTTRITNEFKFGKVELLCNGHFAVAPPSPGYEFENPDAPVVTLTRQEAEALLKILGMELAKPIPASSPSHPDAQGLRRRKKLITATTDLIALLAFEHHLARKTEQAKPGSRNFTGYKLARQGRNLRLPKEIVLEGMRRYHKHIPPHYRDGKHDPYTWSEARRSTESAFKKAPGEPAIPPHIEALRDYGAMARRIVSKLHIPQTRGIRQSSIRSVLEPLVAIALSCGKRQSDGSIAATITHFSYRYAELLTGLKKDTIARVINALTNGKLKLSGIQIEIIKPAKKAQLLSNVYKVTIAAQLLESETEENGTLSHSTQWDSVPNFSVCHDAFQPGALGKESYFVLAALFEMGPATAAELAGRLGKTSDAVRAQLRKLEEFGLVKRLSKRGRAFVWVIGDEVSKKLNEIAERRGTAYKGMDRAAKHGDERRKFKKLLEKRVKL